MAWVRAFWPYIITLKEHKLNEKHSGVGHGSRPVPEEGRGLASAGLDGRLALREHRSEEQGDSHSCSCPVGHLPLAAVGCWRSCWPGPLQGLCWELFFWENKSISCEKNLNLGRFSWRRIHSDLCLSVVAFCLRPLKVKAPPCSHGLLLWEGSELWILWQLTQEASTCLLKGKRGDLNTLFVFLNTVQQVYKHSLICLIFKELLRHV